MKFLIAEDDDIALHLLQVTLERMGHEVLVTRTGTAKDYCKGLGSLEGLMVVS